MRQLLLTSTPFLIAALLSAAPASAEDKASWVDPPGKPAADNAKPNEARTETAGSDSRKSDAAKSDSAKSAEKPSDEKPDTRTARSEPAEADGTARRRAERQARREERRARAAEIRNERRMAARQDRERREREGRLAAAASNPSANPSEIDAGSTPDPRAADWAGSARRLTEAYLDSVSAPNGTSLAAAPRFYGDQVRFHGRTVSTAALIAEKRRFVRRWPERRYEPKDGTMRTACSAAQATCTVRTVLGFEAGNPASGARSAGLSELTLTVSFAGERPVIVAESSRVLRRGSAALSAGERHRDGA